MIKQNKFTEIFCIADEFLKQFDREIASKLIGKKSSRKNQMSDK